jgi:uncharacterized protein
MKRFLFLIFLLASVCSFGQIKNVAPPKPSAYYAVVDVTNTLTPEQKEALNLKLTRYKDSTSSEIAIVIIQSLKGYQEEEVALWILREWGVGGKDRNNGIVILVAMEERKIRIEVGYGLEGAVPDITAKTIVDHDITPEFKAGNHYRGLDKAVDNIIKAAAGEYKAPKGSSGKRGKGIGAGAIFFFIILFIIISSIGGRGGRGGGMMSRRGYRDIGAGWILGSLLGGGSGGGGWSGGSSGGGGFGGFGGGSGGGGGASGSW